MTPTVTAGPAIPVFIVNDADTPVPSDDSATVSPSILRDGTQAGAAGAAALNSGTSLECRFVLVQNSPASAGNLLVGNATSQSIVLIPGNGESIEIDNVNKVYIKLASASAATANWHAI